MMYHEFPTSSHEWLNFCEWADGTDYEANCLLKRLDSGRTVYIVGKQLVNYTGHQYPEALSRAAKTLYPRVYQVGE